MLRADRTYVSTGSPMEAEFAYSRAIVAGDWCFVSGVTGYDYETMEMRGDVGAQASAAFGTITRVLDEVAFTLQDIVRVQYTVTDRAHVASLAPVFQQFLGDVRPAATLVIADLLSPDMKIEIEVTALRTPLIS